MCFIHNDETAFRRAYILLSQGNGCHAVLDALLSVFENVKVNIWALSITILGHFHIKVKQVTSYAQNMPLTLQV